MVPEIDVGVPPAHAWTLQATPVHGPPSAVPYPHWLGTPLPPQIAGATQPPPFVPQVRVPPQPSGHVPQSFPVGQAVSFVQTGAPQTEPVPPPPHV